MSDSTKTPLIPPAVFATLLGAPEPPSEPFPAWRGPPCQTLTGLHWYPFSPRVEDVRFDDFQALARINRYGGHTLRDGYTDAEHGVRCARYLRRLGAPPLVCFAGLHHDTHEAFPPGDQMGPFLRAMSDRAACALLGLTPAAFDGVAAIILRAKTVVREALGIAAVFADPERAALVKRADMVLLATERRDLMADGPVAWGSMPEPLAERIHPWTPAEAWAEFRAEHERMSAEMGRAA